MTDTCFIISPIGDEDSDIRRTSDDLLKYVFRPAAEQCGYSVIRGDEVAAPGQITEQMTDLLLHAELVIADLTNHNPNVFYELAVRHATGKPVIQVTERKTPIPFDLKDFRTIVFDGSKSMGAADRLKRDIVRQIERIRADEDVCANPISRAFTATTADQASLKVFPAPRGRRYNSEFYAFFTARIRAAENDIYITGDGFECADPQGTELARGFHAAFRYALGNGVAVVRIQTKERASQQWSNMLSDLSDEFPDSFNVVSLAQPGVSQMSSVAVIDPDNNAQCVVEIMLQTEKLFGIRAADLAGTAVFVVGRQDLALDMQRRVVSLCKGEQYHYYFAYGSNMDEEQMTERCPTAERVDVAMLSDHALVFNRRGSYRPGGVASVAASPGDRVYGVLWRISSSDLEGLDETEDPDAYERRTDTIRGLDGTSWRGYVYEAIPEGTFEPDGEYLDLLVEAAQKASLPGPYIEGLKAHRPG